MTSNAKDKNSCEHRRLRDPVYDEEDGTTFFVCDDCGVNYVEAGGILSPELNWTIEKPTKPGLYWYRRNESDEGTVVKVDQFTNCLEMNFHDDDRWYQIREGQWAGPLEPPR